MKLFLWEGRYRLGISQEKMTQVVTNYCLAALEWYFLGVKMKQKKCGTFVGFLHTISDKHIHHFHLGSPLGSKRRSRLIPVLLGV